MIRPRPLVAAASAALALSMTVPAVAQAAVVGSPNDKLVTAWYDDVLGRDATAAQQDVTGRAGWVDRLDAGQRREDVLRDITRTPEYADRFVTTIYSGLLGRAPDAGARVWTTGLQAGMAPEWVEQNILASAEYRDRTTTDYVNRLYGVILGRSSNAGERSYWQGRLATTSRLAVVREIWYSTEALDVRVDASYRTLLNRTSDAASGYWRPAMVANRLEADISIASTAEYAAIAQ